MSEMIQWEVSYLLILLSTGIFLSVIYDILRIFRRIVLHGILWMSLEDIVFWMFAGFFSFVICFVEDAGNIRGFAILCEILGACMYHFTISNLLVKVISSILLFPQKMLKKLLKKQDESYTIKSTKKE